MTEMVAKIRKEKLRCFESGDEFNYVIVEPGSKYAQQYPILQKMLGISWADVFRTTRFMPAELVDSIAILRHRVEHDRDLQALGTAAQRATVVEVNDFIAGISQAINQHVDGLGVDLQASWAAHCDFEVQEKELRFVLYGNISYIVYRPCTEAYDKTYHQSHFLDFHMATMPKGNFASLSCSIV